MSRIEKFYYRLDRISIMGNTSGRVINKIIVKFFSSIFYLFIFFFFGLYTFIKNFIMGVIEHD